MGIIKTARNGAMIVVLIAGGNVIAGSAFAQSPPSAFTSHTITPGSIQGHTQNSQSQKISPPYTPPKTSAYTSGSMKQGSIPYTPPKPTPPPPKKK